MTEHPLVERVAQALAVMNGDVWPDLAPSYRRALRQDALATIGEVAYWLGSNGHHQAAALLREIEGK